MVLESFVQALQNFGNLGFLLYIGGGVIIGLVFGIIPGIGGMLAVALLLPFIFVMTPEQGLPLLLAISAVQFTGGSITAILLNIPGTGPNAATLIDGFPMTQKGQGGRAMGAALASSGMGGVASGFLALIMVPLIIPMIMAVRTGDMVFIILMGLSFIGVLGGRSVVKGLISGGLGLIIAFIGFQALTGVSRFTFGSLFLYDGLGLIPVAMGLFALPEMIALAIKGGTIAKVRVDIQGIRNVWEGVRDVFRHFGVWLRATIVGYIIGVIPGVGSEVATFIAYGQAKQTSRNPGKFGTGVVEGVIAPESANNGKEGGALLTTLALGIPGSALMALIIGALLMLGLTPGPQMMTEHLSLSLSLLLVIIAANLAGAVICFVLAPQLAKIAFVPSAILVPLVTVLIFVGAFAWAEYFNDIIVTIIFGMLGLAMRKFGYSRPALYLGYVLGFLFEKYFFIALAMSGPLFFVRPISLTLIFIMVGLFSLNSIRRRVERRRKDKKA